MSVCACVCVHINVPHITMHKTASKDPFRSDGSFKSAFKTTRARETKDAMVFKMDDISNMKRYGATALAVASWSIFFVSQQLRPSL